MNKTSTPLNLTGMTAARPSGRKQASPKKSTLMLIKQFARAYNCHGTLPVSLGGFIAN